MIVPFWHGARVGMTGASGFIGSNLSTELRTLGARVTRIRRAGDDFESVLAASSAVFHLAAQTSAYAAESDSEADYASNVELTGRALKTSANAEQPPRFVFASTATIVGATPKRSDYAGLPDCPETTYDEHKLLAEKGVAMFTEAGMVNGVSLRLTNVFGPGPSSSGKGRGLVNMFIQQALASEPLTVFGDGNYTRDYVFIEDVVAAFLAAAECWAPDWNSSYVVGSGTGRTIVDMAETVLRLVAKRVPTRSKILFVEEPENLLSIDRRHYVAPIDEFTRVSSWRPAVEFDEGVERTIDFYLAGGSKE